VTLDDRTDRSVLGPFALDRVLECDLPDMLGTADAPDRYVVTAIFTRRPVPAELDLLTAPAVHEQLAAAGYPGVTVTAADRRLLIAGTNLHELERGLARTLGVILAEIGDRVAVRRTVRDDEREAQARREASRAASVGLAARRISFDPNGSHYR
jgi:hypothetical protein